jgi:VanZ family protein
VSRLGTFALYWIPIGLWMALIFTASTDALSSSRTSRIIGPLLRWLHPGVSEQTIQRVQTVVRKGGHVTEYAVLALLLWRAARTRRNASPGRPGIGAPAPATALPHRGDGRPWLWSQAFAALLVSMLYAASDEWHQKYVPSRDGRATDVLWDTAGAAAGLGGLWAWGRWKKRW